MELRPMALDGLGTGRGASPSDPKKFYESEQISFL
jgi:hypothetical protein